MTEIGDITGDDITDEEYTAAEKAWNAHVDQETDRYRDELEDRFYNDEIVMEEWVEDRLDEWLETKSESQDDFITQWVAAHRAAASDPAVAP